MRMEESPNGLLFCVAPIGRRSTRGGSNACAIYATLLFQSLAVRDRPSKPQEQNTTSCRVCAKSCLAGRQPGRRLKPACLKASFASPAAQGLSRMCQPSENDLLCRSESSSASSGHVAWTVPPAWTARILRALARKAHASPSLCRRNPAITPYYHELQRTQNILVRYTSCCYCTRVSASLPFETISFFWVWWGGGMVVSS